MLFSAFSSVQSFGIDSGTTTKGIMGYTVFFFLLPGFKNDRCSLKKKPCKLVDFLYSLLMKCPHTRVLFCVIVQWKSFLYGLHVSTLKKKMSHKLTTEQHKKWSNKETETSQNKYTQIKKNLRDSNTTKSAELPKIKISQHYSKARRLNKHCFKKIYENFDET